jgi:hypothetical protein
MMRGDRDLGCAGEGATLPAPAPEGSAAGKPAADDATEGAAAMFVPEGAGLPAIADARLPGAYVAAKRALAELDRIDLCKVWADKAAALAAYARMARDPELENLAKRLRAWALRRAGELLSEIQPDKGGRPAETRTGAGTSSTRTAAADEAGLSKRQKDTALRIAALPAAEFEAMVEAPRPATLDRLDKRARELRGEPSAVVEKAVERQGAGWLEGQGTAHALLMFLADFLRPMLAGLKGLDYERAARGITPRQLTELEIELRPLRQWLRETDEIFGLTFDA